MRRVVRYRFTKGFDEIKLGEAKRDHSGEELFVTELRLKCCVTAHTHTSPVHRLPLPELRKFHYSRKHLPCLTNAPTLSKTITKHRAKADADFRNTWLLDPLEK